MNHWPHYELGWEPASHCRGGRHTQPRQLVWPIASTYPRSPKDNEWNHIAHTLCSSAVWVSSFCTLSPWELEASLSTARHMCTKISASNKYSTRHRHMRYSSSNTDSLLTILNCPRVIKIGLKGGTAEVTPDMEWLGGKGEIQNKCKVIHMVKQREKKQPWLYAHKLTFMSWWHYHLETSSKDYLRENMSLRLKKSRKSK